MSWFVPTFSVVGLYAPTSSSSNPPPTAGAGVDAMIDIGNSKGLTKSLSKVGQASMWAGSLAMSRAAHGDYGQAVGIAAVPILAATAYYTAKAISENFASAAAKGVIEAAGAVSDAIPIIGMILDVLLPAIAYMQAQPEAWNEMAGKVCASRFQVVQIGNGPNNEILPADLFMGETRNPETGNSWPDALTPNVGKKSGGYKPYEQPNQRTHNHASLTELLMLLELPAPVSENAKRAWPKAGLTDEERKVLRKLRLGISSLYVNAITGARISEGETDGGSSLWPLFIDILTSAWHEGRMPRDWLTWRYVAELEKHGGSFKASNALANFAAMFAFNPAIKDVLKAKTPIMATRNWVINQTAGTNLSFVSSGVCPLWDDRAVGALELMMAGWYKLVNSPYSQFKDMEKGWQAAANPLHGPPGLKGNKLYPVFTKKPVSLTALLLLGGAGVAGAYWYRPALVTGAARSVKGAALGAKSLAVSAARKVGMSS